jgi:glucan endo-1,3-alpha-glucosidase
LIFFSSSPQPEDTVWGITLLSEPASVTFEVYPSSGNANGTVLASQTFQASAGLTKLAMPISVPDGLDGGSVSVRARVVRSSDTNSDSDSDSNTPAPNQARADGTVMELDAGSQGFAFVKNPEKFNYNAWVGCVAVGAGVGCGIPNTTTTTSTA